MGRRQLPVRRQCAVWLCSLPSAAGRRGQCGTGSGRSWSWGSPPDLLLGKVGGPVLHLAPLPQPLGGVGASIYVEGRVGEAGNLAEEVRVRMCRVQSEVTWGGCRSYSPLISLMSAHSHLAGAPYAVCRQQRRRMPPPPTCRLARPPSALGFTPAPTLVDKGGIQGSVQARQGAILLSVP